MLLECLLHFTMLTATSFQIYYVALCSIPIKNIIIRHQHRHKLSLIFNDKFPMLIMEIKHHRQTNPNTPENKRSTNFLNTPT
jgi:hypothetical protein